MDQKYRLELAKHGIRIDKNSIIGKRLNLLCEPPVNLAGELHMRGSIGAYTYNRGGRLGGGVKSIGRYCSIAPGLIAGDSNHALDWLSTHPFQWGEGAVFKSWTKMSDFNFLKQTGKRHPVVIGNDVWIGANVIITPGVTVGDGAVIGAGATVTRDVPPYAIIAGSPARILRYRFSEKIIEELELLKWWQYEADTLLGVNFSKIEAAIEEVQRKRDASQLKLIVRQPIRLTGDNLTGNVPEGASRRKSAVVEPDGRA